MKLYLDLDNYDYQPERYKYAVEQMMLTLFPEERPEYPPREGRTLKGETNAARFTLRRSPVWTTVRAQVYRPQGMGQAAVRVGSGQLDRPPEQVYHTLQHALKMAFYQAGTALLGGEPPWGALTGVRPVKLPTRAMLAGATEAQACRELEREYHVSGWRWSAPGPVWRRTGSWKRDRCPCISASPSVPPGAPTAPLSPPTWVGP